jgi:hypothetical protein
VCAGTLIWYLSSRHEPPRAPARALSPATTIAQPTAGGGGLSATVGYNRELLLLRVENRDSFDWSNCELSFNAQGISSGYTHRVEILRPGITAAAIIAGAEFVDADGHRLDPATQPPATLDIACETPQGPRSYQGKFEPARASP